jgi:hypothetical protein
MLLAEADAERLLERFVAYQPPRVEKWIKRDER